MGFPRTCSRASGLLATFTSRTILPVSSTMQMLVSLTDTSNPAKTFTTPIPSVAPLLSREPGGRVRYIDFAANVRNIERNQSGRKSGVRESTGDADRHKGTVEDVDPAGPRRSRRRKTVAKRAQVLPPQSY